MAQASTSNPQPGSPSIRGRSPSPDLFNLTDLPDQRYKLPLLKDEIAAYLENYRTWTSTSCACPKPMCYEEETPQEEKDKLLAVLLEANRKWRIPGSQLPRIYPSEKDWADTPTEYREMIDKAVTINHVMGISSGRKYVVENRFFARKNHIQNCIEYIQEQQKRINFPPYFRLPVWGNPVRMDTQGMTIDEAGASTILFRIEAEACFLEIMAYTNPRISPSIFIHRRKDIPRMRSPYWKKPVPPREILADIEEEEEGPARIRDIPPHITTTRPGRPRFIDPNTTQLSIIPDEPEDTFRAEDFTTDFRRQDVRNLRANTAHRRTSQLPRPSFLSIDHLKIGVLGNLVGRVHK